MDDDDVKDVLPGLIEEHEDDAAPEDPAFAALPGDDAPAIPATSRKVRKRGESRRRGSLAKLHACGQLSPCLRRPR